MINWQSVIKKIAPQAKSAIVQGLADAMPQVIRGAELTTPLRQAHFLAQIAHESAGFKTTTEYATGKEYNGRKDLGNINPGDGVRYKGRGLIQITGRYNYRAMGKALGQDFEDDPVLAAEFPWAALTAAVYWKQHDINRYADRNDIKGVTRIINGGQNGLADRVQYFNKAIALLRDSPAPAPSAPEFDIKAAQKKLSSLSYPLGAIDGKIGPLTRSAIRDFQDAADLPVTGQLDAKTYAALMSGMAPKRPVSGERQALTAADLKAAGSTIVTATDSIKSNVTTAAAALAGASGVASQINDAAGQVNNIKDAIKNGQENLNLLAQNWQIALIIVLLTTVAICIYKCWQYANIAENERVRQAISGENVRV